MKQFVIYAVVAVVAPHAGAWIEMDNASGKQVLFVVAPHAGAWIEIP